MNVGAVLGGILKGQARKRSRFALAFATVSIGLRVWRRFTRISEKPAIRFAVKPGEVYEIRGIRRGR
jgi:hypothetical protein